VTSLGRAKPNCIDVFGYRVCVRMIHRFEVWRVRVDYARWYFAVYWLRDWGIVNAREHEGWTCARRVFGWRDLA